MFDREFFSAKVMMEIDEMGLDILYHARILTLW